MKIKIICTGRTKKGYLSQGMQGYLARLRHYTPLEWVEIHPPGKSLMQDAEKIWARINPKATKVLLAENGEELSSREFAQWLQKQQLTGVQEVDFILGGDVGVERSLFSGVDLCLSLSRMTFTHQMVRLILLEQVYRAFTIIRGEPYHH